MLKLARSHSSIPDAQAMPKPQQHPQPLSPTSTGQRTRGRLRTSMALTRESYSAGRVSRMR